MNLASWLFCGSRLSSQGYLTYFTRIQNFTTLTSVVSEICLQLSFLFLTECTQYGCTQQNIKLSIKIMMIVIWSKYFIRLECTTYSLEYFTKIKCGVIKVFQK